MPLLNKKAVEVENIKISGKKIIIYQGAINVNRGIEQMVEAMQYVDNALLYIFGKGDIVVEITALVEKLSLQQKVKLMGEIPLEKLNGFTLQADLGLSLEEDMGLNYRFALPNKLFNYLQAGVPVLVANLPEMSSLVNEYKVGETIENHLPKHIAEKITSMLTDEVKLKKWSFNAKQASLALNWEKEQVIIKEVLNA